MQTTPLNVLDELYLSFDRDDEAWSVHLEIRVDGHVDRDRLEAAARQAATRHPMARARLADSRVTDRSLQWEIADALDALDLEEIDCPGADDLARARARLLNRTPALDRPGPFALLLAHQAEGDSIVLNLHHAAGDGLAALRLMGSIARAYSGEDDPASAVDPLQVRDVAAMTAPGSIKERLARGRVALDYLGRGVSRPTRLVAQGASDEPGYGFATLAFEPQEVAQIVALRNGRATVNDVLLGGLAHTVNRWNEHRGATSGAIYLMMPINLRPPEWRFDVVGNFASYVSVRIGSGDHTTLQGSIRAAADGTRRVKDGAVAGLIVDLFGAPALVPAALRGRMQDLIPLTGNVIVDTAVLSNLGRIEGVPDLGDAGHVREVWFSPPGRMPLGASLGAATLDGRLFVTLRYRHALFDAGAAAEFLAQLRGVLAAER
ncbi:MAG TPA: condensation domain-containing protein [Baekduia sp.]|nr:condensation domain-containing protein [Baekduia sp.]